ncbi:Lar family restriction alleviation protein [Cloacibacillus sp. An23]|uniref:Lar family restriction alleviation protein n=1 Tax=Cloacibacillus sp. An23 TaxID=1965591 RepID=UPI000B3A5E32|nr:Lar family restriction alleviation protein [Cloacibacillus sp. An23]OUO92582.1 hypothetical protein B5F39_10505 [Cloacibacillus sp. An23]
MATLLRCPFCGGKPVVVVHHTKLYGDCKEVICSECEATVSDLWDYTKDDNGIRKRDAVEVWNSRVR